MAAGEGGHPAGSVPFKPAREWLWMVAGASVGALGLSIPGSAGAGEWELQPRLRLVETYTDNVGLARSDEAEWELITQINPGFSLRGRGRRAELSLDYQMQNLFYAREAKRDSTNHQLGADGSLELVRRTLFLDGSASRTQQLLSPDQTVSGSNLSVTGNRRDVTTYSAGPRLQYAFGNFATGRARYRWRRAEYEGDLEDRTLRTATASLASGRRFNRVGWGVNYQRTEEKPEDLPKHTLESTSGTLSLLLGAKTRVFGVYGYEDNQFERFEGAEPPEGEFWEAGLRFSPSSRTSLEAAYGERFFGETKRFQFQHRGPSTTWEASYNESLTTDTDLQLQRSDALVRDEEGNLVVVDGQPLVVEITVPVIRTQVILQRRGSAGVTWESGAGRIGLSGFWELREYQRTGQEEEIYGGSTRLGWRLSSRSRAHLTGSWTRRQFPDTGREDDIWSGEVGYNRQVGPSTEASLRYRYLQRDSNRSGLSYRENQAEVALDKRF